MCAAAYVGLILTTPKFNSVECGVVLWRCLGALEDPGEGVGVVVGSPWDPATLAIEIGMSPFSH